MQAKLVLQQAAGESVHCVAVEHVDMLLIPCNEPPALLIGLLTLM